LNRKYPTAQAVHCAGLFAGPAHEEHAALQAKHSLAK